MNKKAAGALAGIALVSAMLTAVTTSPAHAASPACGTSCMTLYSKQFGLDWVSAVVPPGTAATGQHVNLGPAGPLLREDWLAIPVATASVLAADGIIPAVDGKVWPSAVGYEYEYAPGDEETSLCLGIAIDSSAKNGTPVSLQPCGVDGATIWLAPSPDTFSPLISGTNKVVPSPYVLTADARFTQLTTHRLVAVPGVAVAPRQLWFGESGVLP
jgi:hypothetical protein